MVLDPLAVSASLLFFAFMIGYLSGSIPYGLLLGKIFGLGDIRKSGSGNIGATNVLRVGGKGLGAATLLLDALKGLVPVVVAAQVATDAGIAVAVGAFIGHLFPVWLRFKGGKGVAVALGVIIGLQWQVGLALCLIWLATAFAGGYSSLAALVAFGLSPLVMIALSENGKLVLFTVFVALVIAIRHRDNIKRLMAGTESKINLRKK